MSNNREPSVQKPNNRINNKKEVPKNDEHNCSNNKDDM